MASISQITFVVSEAVRRHETPSQAVATQEDMHGQGSTKLGDAEVGHMDNLHLIFDNIIDTG